MTKYVYIFHCSHPTEILQCVELYQTVLDIVQLNCNKYSYLFLDSKGKFRSRSSSAKNLEANCKKYTEDPDTFARFEDLEVYNQPKGTKVLKERECGFYVHRSAEWQKKDFFDLSLILLWELSEEELCRIWNALNGLCAFDYMVHFELDASKWVEIFIRGYNMRPQDDDDDTFYSEEEKAFANKLHALNLLRTDDLESVFPLCIVKGNIQVDRSAYDAKELSDGAVMLFKRKPTDSSV